MRLAILLLVAVSCLFGQSQTSGSNTCTTGGAVFGVDSISNVLLFKDPTGYITNVDVPKSTTIVKLLVKGGEASGSPTPMTMNEIQSGDIVCIEKPPDSKTATRITVVTRADVERAQRDFVTEWQTNTVFGPVMTIDVANKKMTVNPVAPVSSLQPAAIVDLSGNVQYRTFPETATEMGSVMPISVGDIQQGQYVFVRGKRLAGEPIIAANTVVKGGVRAIIATFLEAHPLQMTVSVREVGSGKNFEVKIPSGNLYRTTNQLNSPYRVQGPGGLMLDRLGFADLQAGDIVLIIGKADYNNGQAKGLALITRFGYFGTAPNGEKQQLGWFLK